MNIIITGAAGFIGMHVSKKLLDDGHNVTAIDNLNTYYDQTLKQDRLNSLSGYKNFIFYEQDIADKNTIMEIFLETNAECVINLAHFAKLIPIISIFQSCLVIKSCN